MAENVIIESPLSAEITSKGIEEYESSIYIKIPHSLYQDLSYSIYDVM